MRAHRSQSSWLAPATSSVCLGSFAGQRAHYPFHPHEARSLDEHGHVGPQRSTHCGSEHVDVAEVLRAWAESRDGMRCKRSDRKQPLEARGPRVLADLAVERDAMLAHFTHVAEDEPSLSRGARQHRDCSANRIRIGVVRIVENGCAIRALLYLEAPRNGAK